MEVNTTELGVGIETAEIKQPMTLLALVRHSVVPTKERFIHRLLSVNNLWTKTYIYLKLFDLGCFFMV